MGWVLANGPGDWNSIQGRVIPKTQKCLTLSIIRYLSRVKWSNLGTGVVPSPTPWCGSYRKMSFGSPLIKVAHFTLFYYCKFSKQWKTLDFLSESIAFWKEKYYSSKAMAWKVLFKTLHRRTQLFKRWYADFKWGRTDTNDAEHSGRQIN